MKTKKGNIEWYVVEFENGERKKLRNFHADTIFIAKYDGDEGILEYRGITIQSLETKISHKTTCKKIDKNEIMEQRKCRKKGKTGWKHI